MLLTEGGEVEALLLQALVGSRAFGPVFVSGLLPPAAAAAASATVASALVSVHVSIVCYIDTVYWRSTQ